MSIASSVVLVKLNISTWTASKKDSRLTDEVIASNRAGSQSGRFYKNIMAGTDLVKSLSDYAAQCRLRHTVLTFPWEDRGYRGLPTSKFLDYKQEFNERRDTFNRQKDAVCQNFETLKETAKEYLGSMYNANDYPTAEEIYDKYNFQLIFSPMPETGHLVLDVPAQELEEMRATLEQENKERLENATRSSWDRLYKALTGMSEKLTETDDDTKKRWYDSFITNPQELCELLTHLNITKDPDLERARYKLETALVGANIEQIKDSPIVRETLKRNVDDILKQFDW